MTPQKTDVTRTTQESHPVKDYVRDDRVNRVLSAARVAKVRANLDLDGIGYFIVSKRANGELVLLDGGHRATALTEEGFEDWEVPAVVHHDLSEAEEARLFLLYNDRLGVDTLERFRMSVTAEEPEAVILDKIIRDAGFIPAQRTDNRLTCIGAVQSVYRGGSASGREAHPATLRTTLQVIAEAWGTSGSAIKETVRGIGSLLLSHGDKIDEAHLIKVMAELRNGPLNVKLRAQYHIREGGQNQRRAAELAVTEFYNKGLNAKDKVGV